MLECVIFVTASLLASPLPGSNLPDKRGVSGVRAAVVCETVPSVSHKALESLYSRPLDDSAPHLPSNLEGPVGLRHLLLFVVVRVLLFCCVIILCFFLFRN